MWERGNKGFFWLYTIDNKAVNLFPQVFPHNFYVGTKHKNKGLTGFFVTEMFPHKRE